MRRSDSWPELAGLLERVIREGAAAPWVSEPTRALATQLVAALATDAQRAIAGRSTRDAPKVLGLARSAYMRALDGWLSGE